MRNHVWLGIIGWLALFLVPGNQTVVWGEKKELRIEKVEVRFLSNGPVLLLKAGEKAVPIFIDPTVAGSIQGVLSGRKFPRPLSHELMHSILKHYQVKLVKVFVTLRDGIYYGSLTLSRNGVVQVFDSRSSDAVALAVHFKSPIFVEQALMDEAGTSLKSEHHQKDLEL